MLVSGAITSILRVNLNHFRLGFVKIILARFGLLHVNIILLSIPILYDLCYMLFIMLWLLLHRVNYSYGYYYRGYNLCGYYAVAIITVTILWHGRLVV